MQGKNNKNQTRLMQAIKVHGSEVWLLQQQLEQ